MALKQTGPALTVQRRAKPAGVAVDQVAAPELKPVPPVRGRYPGSVIEVVVTLAMFT